MHIADPDDHVVVLSRITLVKLHIRKLKLLYNFVVAIIPKYRGKKSILCRFRITLIMYLPKEERNKFIGYSSLGVHMLFIFGP